MLEQLFGELTLRHIWVLLLILFSFVVIAWLFRVFLIRIARTLAQKTETGLDDAIISALEKPVITLVILSGVYISAFSLPRDALVRGYFSKGLSIVLSLLGIFAGVSLIDALIKWYRREVLGKRKETGLTGRFLTLFRVAMLMIGVLLAVLVVLSGLLGISSAPVTSWIGEHGWRIALIVVLSMVAIIVVGEFIPTFVVRTLARRASESEEEVDKRGDTLSRVLMDTAQVAILLVAAFMVLSELNIDITPILAGFGVVGIAIGFGAQSLVKDIVAGLFIILENQYRVGDVVKIADVSGLVESINLRRTVRRDMDGAVHTVPNGEIRVSSNFTKEWSRVNLNVSVGYGQDLDRVISVINRVGKELAEDPEWAAAILTPPKALRVDNLGDSGIDIKILGETKPTRQWDVTGELRRRLKKTFDEEGIEIPWPHTKVYFGNSPAFTGEEHGARSKDAGK